MVIPPKAAKKFRDVIDRSDIVTVADALGVSVSTIRGYYTGRQEPGLEEAFKIQRLYHIPAGDWLVEDKQVSK